MASPSIRIGESVAVAASAGREPLSLGEAPLFAIFAVEAVALDIVRRPIDMSFVRFAFFDYGSNLSLQSLIAQGLRPGVDFGYTYGLLAAQIGRMWFWCFGLTPAAYQWAMLTGAIFAAWALARIFAGRKIGVPGVALLILSFGFAFQSSYQDLAECVEAVILAHALAAQVRGSYRSALALATVAVFDKPAMGYVYGLLLLILIATELRRRRGTLRDFVDAIAPAAIVIAVLGIVLIVIYGAQSLLFTVVPIAGMRGYRALDYGFIGQGRYLWKPDGGLAAYFLDIPGWWMSSTWYLIIAAAVQIAGRVRGKTVTRSGELVVTCAILHIAYVSLMFGGPISWFYYSYLLVIGCGLATELGSGWRNAAIALCVLAALSWYNTASTAYRGWTTNSPNAETAGLWSSPQEAKEWSYVVARARREKMVVVGVMNGVDVLYPEFGKPVSMFMFPGIRTQGDITRTLAQIAGADLLVESTVARYFFFMLEAPEINAARADFVLDWKGDAFRVYRRGQRARLMREFERLRKGLRAETPSAAPTEPIAQPSGRGT